MDNDKLKRIHKEAHETLAAIRGEPVSLVISGHRLGEFAEAITYLSQKNAQIEAENIRLAEALRFYADKRSHEVRGGRSGGGGYTPATCPVWSDNGKLAQKALISSPLTAQAIAEREADLAVVELGKIQGHHPSCDQGPETCSCELGKLLTARAAVYARREK